MTSWEMLQAIVTSDEYDEETKQFFFRYQISCQQLFKEQTERAKRMFHNGKSKQEIMTTAQRALIDFTDKFNAEYRDEQLDLFNKGEIDLTCLNNRLCWISDVEELFNDQQ